MNRYIVSFKDSEEVIENIFSSLEDAEKEVRRLVLQDNQYQGVVDCYQIYSLNLVKEVKDINIIWSENK